MDYADIQKFQPSTMWEGEWKELHADFSNLPKAAGVYRVKLLNLKGKDAVFHCGKDEITMLAGTANVYLSVGKTTNLKNRLGSQHFSSNHCGNRLGRHLATLFPDFAGDNKDSHSVNFVTKERCGSLIEGGFISIEFLEEDVWWKRDLLESYGKATYKCLFDLGIEH